MERSYKKQKALYGWLPKGTMTIATNRLHFSCHCRRSKEGLLNKVITWMQRHGNRLRGRLSLIHWDQLEEDSRLPKDMLALTMEDRNVWR